MPNSPYFVSVNTGDSPIEDMPTLDIPDHSEMLPTSPLPTGSDPSGEGSDGENDKPMTADSLNMDSSRLATSRRSASAAGSISGSARGHAPIADQYNLVDPNDPSAAEYSGKLLPFVLLFFFKLIAPFSI